MGLMRTVGVGVGAGSDAQLPEESVSTLNHLPTYRQIPGAGTGAGSAPAKRVPVLFSTNRGLYLRLAQPLGEQMEVLTLQPRGQNYNISFCDLERWVSPEWQTAIHRSLISSPHRAPIAPMLSVGGHLYHHAAAQ